MGKVKIILAFILLINLKVFSQFAVEVVDRAEDVVGQRLVFKVKEKFNASNMFKLTFSDETRIQVIILTMDRFKGNETSEGSSTMYSVIWVLKGENSILSIYLDSTLGFAGAWVLDDAAEGIVAMTEKLASTIIKLLQPWEK